jgi:hypothetical protein
LHAGELVANVPVLERAQAREIIAAVRSLRRIDVEVVLIHPTEAGGVGAELRRDAFRHARLQIVQPFEHAGAGEVEIGVVVENDGHQGEAEHRRGAHVFHSGESL